MEALPILGSDVSPRKATPTNGVIYLAGVVRSPEQIISIKWETTDGTNGSGSTECPAWRGQHEIDGLVRAGYRILCVELV